MLVCNDFMAEDISRINDADADRRSQKQGFLDTAGDLDHKMLQGNKFGASDASGASGAKGSRHRKTRTEQASSSSAKRPRQPDTGTNMDNAWSDCWVRPCMYVEKPSDQDFYKASNKAHLNQSQCHAMTITGKHRLVLVRRPPGTGKTQLSAAVTDAWTRKPSKDEQVIAAGPSNTATDNLLDRIADIEGRDYDISRLGGELRLRPSTRAILAHRTGKTDHRPRRKEVRHQHLRLSCRSSLRGSTQ